LAEDINSPATEPHRDETSLTRRGRGRSTAAPRTSAGKVASSRPPKAPTERTAKTTRPARQGLRSLVILTMVGGLVATVALPAYGAWRPAEDAVTLQQVAADDAQSLVVASDSSAAELSRGSYSATTPEEIQKKKDEEAAAAAAQAAAEAAAARARVTSSSSSSVPLNINLVSPGSGEVRWPIINFTLGRGLWDSGYHQGVDLLSSCGEPLYAAAAGVVSVSQESYGGYGVAVSIDHAIGGQSVNTLYGHMTYGSRQVSAGQSVSAGQLIGFVGSTGSSTACHLHFEVHINGGVVDPWAWLQANAG
jgi:murein DD-endopeptidase MepM/ murein hydrolase activator NlpD